jgi:hypothetical protein
MSTFTEIYAVFVGLIVIYPLVILWLQASAFHRLRHKSFGFLGVSTICSFLYIVAAFIPGFLSLPEQQAMTIFYISMIPMIFSMFFGIWGTASLLASYGKLQHQR